MFTGAWFMDVSAAFHDSGASSLPDASSDPATFDYDAYYRDFMAFITANAKADVESKKHSSLIFDIFLPSILLRQGVRWGEYEVRRAMRLRLLRSINEFGAFKYAKLTARLELRYHCRSALVNALNETHIGHSLSGTPGKAQAGDAACMEDHVMQIGIIASTAIQPRQWEQKMCTRALNIDFRRQVLRHISGKEWAGLANGGGSRQASSLEYETGLLARGFLRLGINRPDPARTLLRQNALGWLLKANVLRLPDRVVATACAAPCLNYVFAGMPPVLGYVAALQTGVVGGDDLISGAVALAVTPRPVGVKTGGGGAFKIHPGEDGSPPVATGFLLLPSGSWGDVTLPAAERQRFSNCKRNLRLEPWDDGGLSEVMRKRQPMSLLQVQWTAPPPPSVARLLPAGSVVTQVSGKCLEELFHPSGSAAPLSTAAVAADIVTSLEGGQPIGLAPPMSIETLAEGALQRVEDAPTGLTLCEAGGRWLWLFHPKLAPSSRETTGYPKARVPGMLEQLLREAAADTTAVAMEVEVGATSSSGASKQAGDTSVDPRQSTDLRCSQCRGLPGQCFKPGDFGHLPEAVAYCLACSGAKVKKDPSLRRPCSARGGRYNARLGKTAGRHWPEETLQAEPSPEVVELGGRPSHFAAKAALIREANKAVSKEAQQKAERLIAVMSLLHQHDASPGKVDDARVPPPPPGQKPSDQIKIDVSDRLLEGDMAPPTRNHVELRHVKVMLNELVAGGEASRFAHDLYSGARPLSEALSQSSPPALSTAPPTQGPGAQAAQQQRQLREEANKKQRDRVHAIRVEKAAAERRRRELLQKLSGRFHVRDGQRGGVQRSAGVSRAPDVDALKMVEAELKGVEKTITELQSKLDKACAATHSSSQAGPSSQTGPSTQYGLSAAALAQATDRLASDAKVGDYALMDGADDREYGDGAKVDGRELRYYLIKIRGVRRALTAPEPSDWGLLDTGTQVVDAEYYFLCYRPGNPARWYVAAQPAPRLVTVPTHLLLRVGFRMQLAQLGRAPSKQQRQHVQRNAIVLPIEEHQAAVAELQRRRGRS